MRGIEKPGDDDVAVIPIVPDLLLADHQGTPVSRDLHHSLSASKGLQRAGALADSCMARAGAQRAGPAPRAHHQRSGGRPWPSDSSCPSTDLEPARCERGGRPPRRDQRRPVFHESILKTAPDGSRQTAWYDTGVGTNWYDRVLGGAFGFGLDDKIQKGLPLARRHLSRSGPRRPRGLRPWDSAAAPTRHAAWSA